ncbi:unnamed protein product [Pylaiella littoralis]
MAAMFADVSPTSRRLRDGSGLEVNVKAMEKRLASLAGDKTGGGGWKPADGIPPRPNGGGSRSVEKSSATADGAHRPRLSRKLSTGSMQVLSSMTQLPGRLKSAIVKKKRGHPGAPPRGIKK